MDAKFKDEIEKLLRETTKPGQLSATNTTNSSSLTNIGPNRKSVYEISLPKSNPQKIQNDLQTKSFGLPVEYQNQTPQKTVNVYDFAIKSFGLSNTTESGKLVPQKTTQYDVLSLVPVVETENEIQKEQKRSLSDEATEFRSSRKLKQMRDEYLNLKKLNQIASDNVKCKQDHLLSLQQQVKIKVEQLKLEGIGRTNQHGDIASLIDAKRKVKILKLKIDLCGKNIGLLEKRRESNKEEYRMQEEELKNSEDAQHNELLNQRNYLKMDLQEFQSKEKDFRINISKYDIFHQESAKLEGLKAKEDQLRSDMKVLEDTMQETLDAFKMEREKIIAAHADEIQKLQNENGAMEKEISSLEASVNARTESIAQFMRHTNHVDYVKYGHIGNVQENDDRIQDWQPALNQTTIVFDKQNTLNFNNNNSNGGIQLSRTDENEISKLIDDNLNKMIDLPVESVQQEENNRSELMRNNGIEKIDNRVVNDYENVTPQLNRGRCISKEPSVRNYSENGNISEQNIEIIDETHHVSSNKEHDTSVRNYQFIAKKTESKLIETQPERTCVQNNNTSIGFPNQKSKSITDLHQNTQSEGIFEFRAQPVKQHKDNEKNFKIPTLSQNINHRYSTPQRCSTVLMPLKIAPDLQSTNIDNLQTNVEPNNFNMKAQEAENNQQRCGNRLSDIGKSQKSISYCERFGSTNITPRLAQNTVSLLKSSEGFRIERSPTPTLQRSVTPNQTDLQRSTTPLLQTNNTSVQPNGQVLQRSVTPKLERSYSTSDLGRCATPISMRNDPPHLQRSATPNLQRNDPPHLQRSATPNLQRNDPPHLQRNATPNLQRNEPPHLQRSATPNIQRNNVSQQQRSVTPDRDFQSAPPVRTSNITYNLQRSATPNLQRTNHDLPRSTTPNLQRSATPNLQRTNLNLHVQKSTTQTLLTSNNDFQKPAGPNIHMKYTSNHLQRCATPNVQRNDTPSLQRSVTPNHNESQRTLTSPVIMQPNRSTLQRSQSVGYLPRSILANNNDSNIQPSHDQMMRDQTVNQPLGNTNQQQNQQMSVGNRQHGNPMHANLNTKNNTIRQVSSLNGNAQQHNNKDEFKTLKPYVTNQSDQTSKLMNDRWNRISNNHGSNDKIYKHNNGLHNHHNPVPTTNTIDIRPLGNIGGHLTDGRFKISNQLSFKLCNTIVPRELKNPQIVLKKTVGDIRNESMDSSGNHIEDLNDQINENKTIRSGPDDRRGNNRQRFEIRDDSKFNVEPKDEETMRTSNSIRYYNQRGNETNSYLNKPGDTVSNDDTEKQSTRKPCEHVNRAQNNLYNTDNVLKNNLAQTNVNYAKSNINLGTQNGKDKKDSAKQVTHNDIIQENTIDTIPTDKALYDMEQKKKRNNWSISGNQDPNNNSSKNYEIKENSTNKNKASIEDENIHRNTTMKNDDINNNGVEDKLQQFLANQQGSLEHILKKPREIILKKKPTVEKHVKNVKFKAQLTQIYETPRQDEMKRKCEGDGGAMKRKRKKLFSLDDDD